MRLASTSISKTSDQPILLYDGLCGLCNRTVQFVLKHDLKKKFRFASLQSGFAGRVIQRHGAVPEDLDTVYVVVDYESAGEKLLPRSDAVIFILTNLGPFWWLLGTCTSLVPRAVRDWVYDEVARRRYRVFGKYDACPVPAAEHRSRFLDL